MASPLTVGSLFSGIGGADLGLERAGFRVIWQVEIDDYCTQILAKHWPDVARFRDVRDCGAHNLTPADLIVGGFPCTDISNAGRMAGIDGEQSGLWQEYARIVGALRPRYVLVENVAALLGRGMGRVLGDLSAIGYDAEWSVVSACAMGAPHARERVFLVAYPRRIGRQRRLVSGSGTTEDSHRQAQERRVHRQVAQVGTEALSGISSLAEWWRVEPRIPRMVSRVPNRVDRLRVIGNIIVPQVAEYIGRLIMQHAEAS